MQLQKAELGCYQLRGGRSASILEIKDGKGIGLRLPIKPQGEPEMGHSWKADGSYSVQAEGVPHTLDLIQKVSSTPKSPADFMPSNAR